MFQQAIRLRDGVDPAVLATDLDRLAMEGRNVGGGRTGIEHRDAFILWAESVEERLAAASFDPALTSRLLTDRYWQVRSINEATVRPIPLVAAEMGHQVEVLKAVVEHLRKRLRAAEMRTGLATVLDTNVLLHHEMPDRIRWPELLKVRAVRLVVPLAVVAEIDEKKYAGSPDVRKRARKVVPQLERLLTGASGGEIRAGVTLEVPPTFERRLGYDADTWVLDSCRELAMFGAGDVRLVTGDAGMAIRGRAEGIAVFRLPEDYRIDKD